MHLPVLDRQHGDRALVDHVANDADLGEHADIAHGIDLDRHDLDRE